MPDPLDNKKIQPFGIDVITYAGTPSGIPSEELDKNWGGLNKQLAFSNLSDINILDIDDLRRIQQLKTMSCQRDYELRTNEQNGSSQADIVEICLTTLGKGGFLLKQATTQRHEITQRNEESKKPRFMGIGARQPQQQQQQQQQQPGRVG
jgi:ribosomal protein L3